MMRGIIYKDYQLLKIPKNYLTMLSNIVVSLLVVVIFPTFYGLALTVALSIPLSGTTLLQISMEQDDKVQFDKFQLTFPLTKKQIVLSKYIAGFFLEMVFFVMALLVALYYHFVIGINLEACFMIWLSGIAVGLILFAISYAGFYWLGNKRGTILYLVMTVGAAFVYLFSYFSIDMAGILTVNPYILIAIALVIGLILMYASFVISLKLYQRQYS